MLIKTERLTDVGLALAADDLLQASHDEAISIAQQIEEALTSARAAGNATEAASARLQQLGILNDVLAQISTLKRGIEAAQMVLDRIGSR